MVWMMRGLLVGAAALMLLGASMSARAEDPFLWLEQRNGDRATAWVAEQNARTQDELQSDPRFAAYVDTAYGLFSSSDNIASGYVQGGYVYNFWQDGEHNLGLWRRTDIASYKTATPVWDTILDIDALAAAEGTNWVYEGADCLPPVYQRCLVKLSPDGGDAAEVREFDLASRRFVENGFRSPVSKSELYWFDEDTLILLPAYEEAQLTSSGYPRQVRLWKRGTAAADAELLMETVADDLSSIGYLAQDGDRSYFIIGRSIDFYNSQMSVRLGDGTVKPSPLPDDSFTQQNFDGQLVFTLRSAWAAPDGNTYAAGGLYAFDFDAWLSSGKIGRIETLVAPSERTAVLSTARTKDRLFVAMIDNVRGRVLSFSHADGGWTSRRVALPDNGDVAIAHADPDGASVSFSYTDFLTPPSVIWSDDGGETLTVVKGQAARFDASPYRSEQFEAISKDGTRVPYFVVRRKDLAGPAPTLLYGYGGFEEAMTPWYSGMRGRLWLDQGNVWVLANIRGGGEFGPQWHQAAVGANRQRAYDDFAAVAEDLVTRGLTTSRQLAAVGGSNGGLLAGVMLTQRPELFGAIICEVPLLDMLRYTLLPAGASWIAEYGDPAIAEEAAVLAKYSPYNNVHADTTYPPVLFLTSTADDRVHPAHARKMAALMQSQGHDALFYEETEGGHGGSGDLRRQAAFFATEFLFLQRELESVPPAAVAASREASREPALAAEGSAALDCGSLDAMNRSNAYANAITPSQRTRRAELLRLCARIGYSPPALR